MSSHSIAARTNFMNQLTERFVPWIIFLLVMVVYLSFPTRNYYWDGVDFAHTIEISSSLKSLIHPNHLIYNVAGYLIYKVLRSIGFEIRALVVLQITNGILSALSAVVFFHILRRGLRSIYLSIILTFLFSFSATWWRFSTDANAYVPAVLFLLVSFYLTLPAEKPRPLLVALVHAASMLFHQLGIFFFPVIVLGIWQQTSELDRRRRISHVVRYSAAVSLLTASSYFFCFYFQTGTFNLRRFMKWLTSYSPEIGFQFNAWDNLMYTLRGQARLFFGGRFSFLAEVINPFILALVIILAALLVWLLIKLFRHPQELKAAWRAAFGQAAEFKGLARLACVWFGVYLIFLFFWIPQHTFYRLFYLPSLILLCGIALAPYVSSESYRRRWRAALFVAVVSLANFLFVIYPYSRVMKDTPLSLALEIKSGWPDGAVVYYETFHSDNRLVEYFNPMSVWKPVGAVGMEALENELRNIYGQGGTVWIETTAMEKISATPQGAAWLSEQTQGQPTYELATPQYKLKFVRLAPRPNN